MRPSHTNKGAKRYRYYVSPALIESSVETGASGWRVPAAEIERALADAVRGALIDPSRRSAVVADVNSAQCITAVLDSVDHLVAQLQDPTQAESRMTLGEIVRRVDLTETECKAEIDLRAMIDSAWLPDDSSSLTFAVTALVRIDRRGASVRLVLLGAADEPTAPDPQLAQTVIAARRRLTAYTSPSQPKSVIEMAADEGTDPADVSRSLQLAFLAPDLVEAILDGRHPAGLTARGLQRLDKLPLLWSEQRTALS